MYEVYFLVVEVGVFHRYRGVIAALTTKHDKEKVLGPALARIGISLRVFPFDTDQFGTFSGETTRSAGQRETALNKARTGLTATGLLYGIASEGSVGPDPIIPFINSDLEAIAWIDNDLGFELVEFHRSVDIVAIQEKVRPKDSLENILKKADFPNHALIVRPEKFPGSVFKGIRTLSELEAAIVKVASENQGPAIVESDLRAHMSPSRMKNVSAAAEQLVRRLETICKECKFPGFGVVEFLKGAECELCGEFIQEVVIGKKYGCVKCEYTEEEIEKRTITAANCPRCNP